MNLFCENIEDLPSYRKKKNETISPRAFSTVKHVSPRIFEKKFWERLFPMLTSKSKNILFKLFSKSSIPVFLTNEKTFKDIYINKIKNLGIGAYGKVTLHKKENKTFAIKITALKNNIVLYSYLLKEIGFLVKLNHFNIINLISAGNWNSNLAMVMEYADIGSLSVFKGNVNFKFTINVFYQLLHAIGYCHEIGIIHRDIKLDNVMFSNNNIKLVDFGSSVFVNNVENFRSYEVFGTPYYKAPELFLEQNYNFSVDIWATSCLIFELIFGYPCFQANYEFQLLEEIFKTFGSPTKNNYPLAFKSINIRTYHLNYNPVNFIENYFINIKNISLTVKFQFIAILNTMFLIDPNLRPRAQEILKMNLFNKNRDINLENKLDNIIKLNNSIVKCYYPSRSSINFNTELTNKRNLAFLQIEDINKNNKILSRTYFLTCFIFDQMLQYLTVPFELDKIDLYILGCYYISICYNCYMDTNITDLINRINLRNPDISIYVNKILEITELNLHVILSIDIVRDIVTENINAFQICENTIASESNIYIYCKSMLYKISKTDLIFKFDPVTLASTIVSIFLDNNKITSIKIENVNQEIKDKLFQLNILN